MTYFDHDNAGRVIAFKRGGQAPMPTVRRREPGRVQVEALDVDASVVERGRALYGAYCLACHGAAAVGSGLYPDLRFASQETHLQWNAIVLGGLRAERGMAGFAGSLDVEQVQAIRAYVLDRAWAKPSWWVRLLSLYVDAGGCFSTRLLTD